MLNENITIPYYVVFASEYVVFRGKLSSDEIVEVFDAVADICLFGKSDFKTDNSYQQRFFEKIIKDLDKNAKKYIACVQNGRKGGRPKNQNETQKKPIGFENENLDKTESKPKTNLDETNIIEYNRIESNKIEYNIEEENKRIDTLFDPITDKCFSIYSEFCPELPKIKFERRNKPILDILSEYLFETKNDLEYFKEVCIKANELKTICDNVIDFKSILKNHIAIYNGKFKKNNNEVISKLKFS